MPTRKYVSFGQSCFVRYSLEYRKKDFRIGSEHKSGQYETHFRPKAKAQTYLKHMGGLNILETHVRQRE